MALHESLDHLPTGKIAEVAGVSTGGVSRQVKTDSRDTLGLLTGHRQHVDRLARVGAVGEGKIRLDRRDASELIEHEALTRASAHMRTLAPSRAEQRPYCWAARSA